MYAVRGLSVRRALVAVALAGLLIAGRGEVAAQTLNQVKDRGNLVCGVSDGLLGFSIADAKGDWSGLDVDLCRAIAAAIFNDSGKVKFVPLSTGDRFTALKSGQVDVLSRNSTWTMSRETDFGLLFAATTYYDGQGFLVRRSLNVEQALELGGKAVCVQTSTTTELNLADFFRANRMQYQAVALAGEEDAIKEYESGRCAAYTSDASALHAVRVILATPGDHVILPDIVSKEPLGPAVRQGDDQWFNIVKWTHFAMLNAEELGVSSARLDEALKSERPDVRRLLGLEGTFGEQIGLTKDWVVRIVRLVGNYSEVFERNVGTGSKLAIPRGINQLWSNGGIQYAPPIR
jgi:general L-amino acid transport system substrate-binding protein